MLYFNHKEGKKMEKTYNKRKFDIVINGTHTFLRFATNALYVLLGLIIIGAIGVLFVPKGLLDFDLANLQNINVNVMNTYFEIDESLFTGIVNVKGTILLFMAVAIVNLSFVQYLMLLIKWIIGDVKNQTPFTDKNVKRLKLMSYVYLGASVIIPLVSRSFFYNLVDKLQMSQLTVNFSPNFQFIFMGIIIFILAIIFEHGVNLQEDHDMTV